MAYTLNKNSPQLLNNKNMKTILVPKNGSVTIDPREDLAEDGIIMPDAKSEIKLDEKVSEVNAKLGEDLKRV